MEVYIRIGGLVGTKFQTGNEYGQGWRQEVLCMTWTDDQS